MYGVSECDQLQLEYSITLNDFQAQANTAEGVPPPRQTDEIESTVTIPDGHTVIVGGLNRTSHTRNTDSFPLLDQIPIIREAVSSNTNSWQKSSLFVFLKPVILRDDKFRDLKYFSNRDVKRARVHGDFPRSEPLIVR